MTTMSLLLLAFSFPAGNAFSQAAKELVGSWTLISVTVNRGGDEIDPFGPNPKGTMMFDRNGRFSIVVTRSELPKFASNNREMGTPEENKAISPGEHRLFRHLLGK